MEKRIKVRGYTNVLLVLDMKDFACDEEVHRRFETLRGTDTLAKVIREDLVQALDGQPFLPLKEYERRLCGETRSAFDEMSSEEIGYASGVFRALMLERFAMPCYALDKAQVQFDEDLESNLQFRKLFLKVWDRWDIYLRPTMTGFFILRLTYRYEKEPRALLDVAKDVVRLQEPFDIRSALRWREYKREQLRDNPDELAETERSIQALFDWLGVPETVTEETAPRYYPVQWKLAVEVVNNLLKVAPLQLPGETSEEAFCLQPFPRDKSVPVYDSYVIYHFDEMLVERMVLQGRRVDNAHLLVPATVHDVRKSKVLRNVLTNLLEGSILREPRPGTEVSEDKTQRPVEHFPSPRWSRADALMEDNLASWNDELCLFTSRTALFIPARKWRDCELAVSTIPGATLKVRYARYWSALERMVEFALEIRMLAQLLESESYSLLEEIAETIERIRRGMFAGDIVIDRDLKEHLARVAHLQRVVALAQSLSHAPMWSRAEYAVQKAEALLERLNVPHIFVHVQRNMESINNTADHVDELYTADLAEKNNQKTTLLSIGLAAASFILTLLVLPSFWADLTSSRDPLGLDWLYPYYLAGGTILAGVMIVAASCLLALSFRRRSDIRKVFQVLFSSPSKPPSKTG
ncbi:hypothetical protein D6833_13240 [Candidatus Parcubacteria bacterium]|nr:MAG: hypothetical protein D6833_13240 [Candidatus Parcubacteria bacterium]